MTSKPRVGRPRLSGHETDRRPREEILAVASRLFSERGVGSTTMRGIAEAAGLQQSSLYYYFSSKDEILATVVAEANRFTLDHLRRIEREGSDPPRSLHRLIRFDVIVLCSLPYDINEVGRLAQGLDPDMSDYWKDRSALHRGVERLVVRGVEHGHFLDVDPTLTALAILADDEATQHWYRGDALERLVPRARDRRRLTREAVADHRADLTLAGLVTDRRQLAAIGADSRTADPIESIRDRCTETIGRLSAVRSHTS